MTFSTFFGVNAPFTTGNPFEGDNITWSKYREGFGALKGLTPTQLEARLWGHIYLKLVSRDLGALKGV